MKTVSTVYVVYLMKVISKKKLHTDFLLCMLHTRNTNAGVGVNLLMLI
jgi:hypothetical protein